MSHIASGCIMRAINDVITVRTQSNDGHGWSSVSLMLSVSSPKAANATLSCAKRSGMNVDNDAGGETNH